MTAFTPGPWQGCLHLRSDADQTCGCGYRGGIWSTSSDVLVCEMASGRELGADMIPISDRSTVIADAFLIAAAPDLYAALQTLSDLCVGTFAEGGTPHKAALSALAKARGEAA